MEKIVGGKIPNYDDKSELIIDTNENKILSYNVLNKNQNITIFDQNNNIIRYSDIGNIYKLNNDFELEKLPDDTPKIKPTLNQDIFINKEFVINGIKYPYYYIFNNEKFKFADFLLSENINDDNKIRIFIKKLYLFNKDDKNKIFNINKLSNLFNKYIFINKFKFLLEILFKNYNEPIQDLDISNIAIQEDIENIITKSFSKKSESTKEKLFNEMIKNKKETLPSIEEITKILIDSSIKTKVKEIGQKQTQFKDKLNKLKTWDENSDAKILNDNIMSIKYTLSLPQPSSLSLDGTYITRYTTFYNKFYYIKNILKTIFKINSIDNSKLNLINLDDLNSFQHIVYRSYHAVKSAGNESSIYSRLNDRLIIENEKYLDIDIESDEFNVYNNYLIKEIVEIFDYIDNINIINKIQDERMKGETISNNRPYDLAMIIILGYFHKRVFYNKTLNSLNFDAFPINQNNALNDLFRDSNTIVSQPIIRSFYISDLPIYYPYQTVTYKGTSYPDCLENSILQFIKTFYWYGPVEGYKVDNIINLKLKNILEKYIIENKDDSEQCKNELLEILNNIEELDFTHKKGEGYEFNSEINCTYKNILICINYLLTDNNIISDTRNIDLYKTINKNIVSLSLDENNITLQTIFGSITLKYISDPNSFHAYIETSSTLEIPILSFLYSLNLFVSKDLEIFKNDSNDQNLNILMKMLRIDSRNDRMYFQHPFFNKIMKILLYNKFNHLFPNINYYEKYNYRDIEEPHKISIINNPIFFKDYILLPYLILSYSSLLYIKYNDSIDGILILCKLLEILIKILFNNDLLIFFIYNDNLIIKLKQGHNRYEKIINFFKDNLMFWTQTKLDETFRNRKILDQLFTILLFFEIITTKDFNKDNIPNQCLKLLYDNEDKKQIFDLISNINLSHNFLHETYLFKNYINFVLDRMININGEPLELIKNLQDKKKGTPLDRIIDNYLEEYELKKNPGAALESAKKYLKTTLRNKYLKFKTKYNELKNKLNK